MTKDTGDNLFVTIAAKWIVSGTDDEDNDIYLKNETTLHEQ